MDELNASIQQWVSQFGWTTEAVVKLFLAAVFGGLVGLEREVRGREAGFRTNILVCVGSALVMLVSIRFAYEKWPQPDGFNLNVDPARIAYGIMTGIGFLGAGAIIKQQTGIRGLTTAAGLWCVAAIGMAVGLGLYVLSGATAVMVVAALWLLDYLDYFFPTRHFRRLTVRCKWDRSNMDELTKRLKARGLRLEHFNYQRLDPGDVAELDVTVSFLRTHRYRAVEAELHDDPVYTLISSVRI
jgi:putative Mg2+ transporter-C (MgtC) family protein